MSGQKREFEETLAFRVAKRMFESSFAACEKLPEAEQQVLMREIAKRVLAKIPSPATEMVKPIRVVGIQIQQHNSEGGGSDRD
jgi:hypothetical protein